MLELDPWRLRSLVDSLEPSRGRVDPFQRLMLENLNHREGFVTYPYRDTEGNLTVGLGMRILADRDARGREIAPREFSQYDYTWRDYPVGTAPVDRGEVNFQMRQLEKLPYGPDYPAPYYKPFSSIGFGHDAVVSYALDRMDTVLERVREQFPEFDTYPAGVREAIMDLAWNAGEGDFAGNWPLMSAAIKRRDWETAARESAVNRPSPAEYPGVRERNVWRRDKLLEPDYERMYPVSAYPGYQAPPPAADGTYGQGGYPGYAPAAPGEPGAGATSKRRTPTLEELHAMSDEDFDANWDRVIAAARGPSIL